MEREEKKKKWKHNLEMQQGATNVVFLVFNWANHKIM